MAESVDVLQALKLVQDLPDGLHWYCSRQSAEDASLCFEEDLRFYNPKTGEVISSTPVDEKLLKETRARQDLVTDALEIFAYDLELPKQWFESRLSEQLSHCDICVREFHRARRKLKQKLMNQYGMDEVLAFMHTFDKLNVERIERGLQGALQQLESVPQKERSIRTLDTQAVHSVFEALNCKPFLSSDEELDTHFATFFSALQTNKPLRLGGYTPAMIWFIFGNNVDRRKWAIKEWTRMKRPLMPTEFESCVQDPLLFAMPRVQLDRLDINFLKTFWDGIHLILTKVDQDIYTHSLRAMDGQGLEIDICRLAYSHLQVDSDAFIPLLNSIRHVLEISPADFWEALGTVSPQAWLDQFFASRALHRLIAQDTPPLEDLFGWMSAFMKSIKAVNQPPTARMLVSRLLNKFNNTEFPDTTADYCSKMALQILTGTLSALAELEQSDIATSMSADALNIAEEYLRQLIQFSKRTLDDQVLAGHLIHQALALDLKCFTSTKQRLDLADQSRLSNIRWNLHTTIWRQVALNLPYGSTVLAKQVLSVLYPLTSVERYATRLSTLPVQQAAFNDSLQSLRTPICDILDRIQAFSPLDLEPLYVDDGVAQSIISLLFNSDSDVRAAAMDLVKTLSDKDTRKDAIEYLLRKHYATTLIALHTTLDHIAQGKCFVPASSTLKVLADVMEVMCNQQDGYLRSETLTRQGAVATSAFWNSTWKLLKVMFLETQKWNQNGHDKNTLMNFCRDAMEFADKAFDQFGVLAGALKSSQEDGNTNDNDGKMLIVQPRLATSAVIEWLKLRDDVLVSKSCALVCKLLTRLKEFNQRIGEDRLNNVLEIIIGTSRSTLTGPQKAELSRALEIHADIHIDNDEPAPSSRQPAKPAKPMRSQVIDLEAWQSKADRKSKTSSEVDDIIDELAPSYRKLKEQREAAAAASQSSTRIVPRLAPKINAGTTVSTSDFLRKRELEKQEKKRRDALAAAALKKRAQGAPSSIAGEGTGTHGIGVVGKMHDDEKGEGMMVSDGSSSSSEDEESAELDRELFGIGGKKGKPLKGLTSEQANALRQQRRGPVKKQRIQRSKNQDRARLAPDLGPLHKEILFWNYFHDGNFPPKRTASDYTAVLKTFRDPNMYQNTFSPLLMLEAWNGFLKAKEENTSRPYQIKITLRSSVDAFLEISTTMSHADGKEIGEGDIVLFSKSSTPTSSPDKPNCLCRVGKINRKKKSHLEVTYRTVPGTSLAPLLALNSELYAVKITSIIPLEREYGALDGLKYYDLCQEIINAEPSPILNYKDESLEPLMKSYGVNKAQAKAIKSAFDNDGFTLIQGPPGSGKTKTIVATAGALLTEPLRLLQSTGTMKQKMLVCAPSNAAVDELVMRFKEGIKLINGELRKISVVRLGRSDAINTNVLDVTLDELVNKKLNAVSKVDPETSAKTQKLFIEHKDVAEQLRHARELLNAAEEKSGPTKQEKEKFDDLRRRKALLGQQIDVLKDGEQQQMKQADVNYKRAQQQVLEGAHVICATLSGSGHDMFQNMNIEFETVIIDEAAQCVELSALIPLKYGCAKCILVGDPQQLPPTVFSRHAAQFKYEQSLFVRMQGKHPKDVHLLDTQYRMHPEISAFPSEAFYDSRLVDGPGMARLRGKAWHNTELLSPYRFFDVQGQHQAAPKGHSLINIAEINVAMQLYRCLTSNFRDYNFRGKIGIITPYKSQLRELKNRFQQSFGTEILESIEFNTTDAFQGRESEIIIFSCVRASPAGGIGFLQDVRRMNVGLTRAKSSLWVLGNSESLMRGEFWAKLVTHSQKTGRYTTGQLDRLLSQPLKVMTKMEDYGDNKPVSTTKGSSDAMDIDSKPTQTRNMDAKPAQIKNEPVQSTSRVSTNGAKPKNTIYDVKPAPPPAPSVNIFSKPLAMPKRKLSPSAETKSKIEVPAKRSKPEASSSSSSGGASESDSDSDMEMTDAPQDEPSLAKGSAPSASAPTKAPPKSNGAPAPPKRKKEVNVFMKKKPRKG